MKNKIGLTFVYLILFTLSINIQSAKANEYKFFTSAGPGTATHAIAQTLSEIYKNNTGNSLIITTVTGGNNIPAVNQFKAEKIPTLFVTTGGINLFNYALVDSLPYKDSDFKHLMRIGELPSYYVTRADSDLKTPSDIVYKLAVANKPLVGTSNGTQAWININSINAIQPTFAFNKKTKQIVPVNYKTPGEVLVGLTRGDIDVALISLTETSPFAEPIREGKIKIVATTSTEEHKILDIAVPSLPKQTGIKQFDGQIFLSINPLETPEAEKFARDILKATENSSYVDILRKNNVIAKKEDNTKIKDIIDTMRKDIVSKKSLFAQKENTGIEGKQ